MNSNGGIYRAAHYTSLGRQGQKYALVAARGTSIFGLSYAESNSANVFEPAQKRRYQLMKQWNRKSAWRCFALFPVFFAVLFGSSGARSEEYFDKYYFNSAAGFVDLGVQPNAYPLAFISAVMMHDRILRDELKQKNLALRVFPFKKGNDIVKLMGNGKLEVAFLGDMPTVNTIVTTPTAVVGLGKRNFSSIVSRDFSRLDELKGHKIGFSAGSSSHLVLMRGLKGTNMTDKDVTLVPLEPAAMPDALDKGEVDAYSAWEPTPSISLARSPKNRAIYRGMSTDWVVFSREFAERDSSVTQMLVAAYVRSLNWMRKSKENLDRAGAWVLAETEKFNGEPAKVTAAKAIEIARKDLLEVPGAPSIPTLVDGAPPLSREFAFLKEQGRIPPTVDESVIHEAFAFDGLRKVQGDPKKYRLFTFDYQE